MSSSLIHFGITGNSVILVALGCLHGLYHFPVLLPHGFSVPCLPLLLYLCKPQFVPVPSLYLCKPQFVPVPSLYPCPVCFCASPSMGLDLCPVLCPPLPLSPGISSWRIPTVGDDLIQTPLPKMSSLRFRLVPSERQRQIEPCDREELNLGRDEKPAQTPEVLAGLRLGRPRSITQG